MLAVNASTIGCKLQSYRQQRWHCLGTTKAGTLLKHWIPIWTVIDWDETRSGFLETDLVARCSDLAEEQSDYTPIGTGLAKGRIKCLLLTQRSQLIVLKATIQLNHFLLFALQGIDCNNDSTFANGLLKRYCEGYDIFNQAIQFEKVLLQVDHSHSQNCSLAHSNIGSHNFETVG